MCPSPTYNCLFRPASVAPFDQRPSARRPFGLRVAEDGVGLLPFKVLPYEVPHCPPWLLTRPQICRDLPIGPKADYHPALLRAFILDHMSSHDCSEHVFTDGSKTSTGVGAAVVFPSFSAATALPPAASIYTAELAAILSALYFISFLPSGSFTIFTDSRSVLQAIGTLDLGHPLIAKVCLWLHALSVSSEVKFCWVPSHIGVAGNEKADVLAKAASSYVAPADAPLPHRDHFPAIRDFVQREWQLEWDVHPPTKLHSIKPLVKPWPESRALDRRRGAILTRLRIGHTRLTHGFLMSGDECPTCAHCGAQLTVLHIFTGCHFLRVIARRHFNFIQWDWPPAEVLHAVLSPDSMHFNIDSIFNFLREVGLLDHIC